MSDIREFPMQPPADVPEVIEIAPLQVWPFLEAQWERDRKERQERQMEDTIVKWLRGDSNV
jgi:hypothetical protein